MERSRSPSNSPVHSRPASPRDSIIEEVPENEVDPNQDSAISVRVGSQSDRSVSKSDATVLDLQEMRRNSLADSIKQLGRALRELSPTELNNFSALTARAMLNAFMPGELRNSSTAGTVLKTLWRACVEHQLAPWTFTSFVDAIADDVVKLTRNQVLRGMGAVTLRRSGAVSQQCVDELKKTLGSGIPKSGERQLLRDCVEDAWGTWKNQSTAKAIYEVIDAAVDSETITRTERDDLLIALSDELDCTIDQFLGTGDANDEPGANEITCALQKSIDNEIGHPTTPDKLYSLIRREHLGLRGCMMDQVLRACAGTKKWPDGSPISDAALVRIRSLVAVVIDEQIEDTVCACVQALLKAKCNPAELYRQIREHLPQVEGADIERALKNLGSAAAWRDHTRMSSAASKDIQTLCQELASSEKLFALEAATEWNQISDWAVGKVLANGVREGSAHFVGRFLATMGILTLQEAFSGEVGSTEYWIRTGVLVTLNVAPAVLALMRLMYIETPVHEDRVSNALRGMQFASVLVAFGSTTGLVLAEHSRILGPMTPGLQAMEILALGAVARQVRQILQSQTSHWSPTVLQLTHADGTALGANEKWVMNVYRDLLYTGSSFVTLALGGAVLGTHVTGVLTQLGMGLEGAEGFAARAAALSILGTINEFIDGINPEFAKFLMANWGDGAYIIADDPSSRPSAWPPGNPLGPAILRDIADQTSSRITTGVYPDMFNIGARLADRMGAGMGWELLLLTIGAAVLGPFGGARARMLTGVKATTSPNPGDMPPSSGLLTAVANPIQFWIDARGDVQSRRTAARREAQRPQWQAKLKELEAQQKAQSEQDEQDEQESQILVSDVPLSDYGSMGNDDLERGRKKKR